MRERGTVIVAEGYMDVIALAQAGFANAVAPLGTAITEAQLALLWQLADEPVVCLDGDEAGLRAAHRLIERALPVLKPGKSLRFALLPRRPGPGQPAAQRAAAGARAPVLEEALPLIEFLWRRETRRPQLAHGAAAAAALDAALSRSLPQTIPDRELRWLFRAGVFSSDCGRRSRPRAAPAAAGRRSRGAGRRRRRGARASASCCRHGPSSPMRASCSGRSWSIPELLHEVEEELGGAGIRRAGARCAAPGDSFLVRRVRPP